MELLFFDDSTKDLEFVDLSGNKELKVVVFSSPQNNLKYLDLSYCSIIKIVFLKIARIYKPSIYIITSCDMLNLKGISLFWN
jgi:Leucine-rich repeat (LRR) protein